MGKVCSIVSVKGGTGKTTTSVNTGLALSREGFKVLVLDANLEGSNLSFHLGLSTHDIATIHDVLRRKCKTKEAIYTHPSGMNLMLGGVYLDDMKLRDRDLKNILKEVRDDFDFVIIDCSSGLSGSVKSAIDHSDEVIIVTNPELPAVVDAFKIVQYCEQNTSFIRGVVVNRNSKQSELTHNDVETILGKPVIGVVPEDNEVKKAMKERTPIVSFNPKRRSAKEFQNIAFNIGELDKVETTSFWKQILKRLGK